MTCEMYNGWANYETWNVALYIANEYGLYLAAVEYAKRQNKFDRDIKYVDFVDTCIAMFGGETPDGVNWTGPELDLEELDEALREYVED